MDVLTGPKLKGAQSRLNTIESPEYMLKIKAKVIEIRTKLQFFISVLKSARMPYVIDEWLRIAAKDGGVGGALERKNTKK